ncbi:hypothetical protein E2C01_101720 [Portunus trituberculatus]|uniref:Uncharacterized protein n=1 Tax=Portunus trituberculatus TaxID=210409 RepID=A0A5B7KGF2_PORTR|nr:hypothetical protein [Portunus trituberculatus]
MSPQLPGVDEVQGVRNEEKRGMGRWFSNYVKIIGRGSSAERGDSEAPLQLVASRQEIVYRGKVEKRPPN